MARTKCEACQTYGRDNVLIPAKSGKLIQLCPNCHGRADEVAAAQAVKNRERLRRQRSRRPGPPPGSATFEVRCGDLHETIVGAAGLREAAALALEKSEATRLAPLLCVRELPGGRWGGRWHYLDPIVLASEAAES